MRFQVPQFIEIEDRIFGPLTLKQFLYIAGSAGLGFVLFRLLGFLGIALALPVVALGLALAFYKFNNKPFIFLIESAFGYATRGKLYLWRKADKPAVAKRPDGANDPLLFVPKLSRDTLKDMTWNLDTNESLPPKNSASQNDPEGRA